MINTKTAIAVAKAVALMLVASSAHAQVTNLVKNGSFEQTTPSEAKHLYPGTLQLAMGSASGVNDWTNASRVAYNVIPSAITSFLWSTQNGGPNVVTTSPDGGNVLAMDSDSEFRGAISQNISGLKPGDSYQLSFYSALGQQHGWHGKTWDWMKVSLGSQQQNVWLNEGKATQLPNHGFTGWQSFNLTFQATAATETLSFLAMGGPNGAPPMILLDGVSLAPVPEPEEWAMMLVGAGLVSYQVRRKQAKLEQTKLDV